MWLYGRQFSLQGLKFSAARERGGGERIRTPLGPENKLGFSVWFSCRYCVKCFLPHLSVHHIVRRKDMLLLLLLLLVIYLVREAIGTAANPGLLYQPRVIVKMIVEKQMECRLAGETRSSRRKPAPAPLLSITKSHMTRHRFEPGPPRWEAGE
jgi:hypothetical protein